MESEPGGPRSIRRHAGVQQLGSLDRVTQTSRRQVRERIASANRRQNVNRNYRSCRSVLPGLDRWGTVFAGRRARSVEHGVGSRPPLSLFYPKCPFNLRAAASGLLGQFMRPAGLQQVDPPVRHKRGWLASRLDRWALEPGVGASQGQDCAPAQIVDAVMH